MSATPLIMEVPAGTRVSGVSWDGRNTVHRLVSADLPETSTAEKFLNDPSL